MFSGTQHIYRTHLYGGKRTSLDILAKEISDQTENGLQNMKELNRMHNLKYTLVILYKGLWVFF